MTSPRTQSPSTSIAPATSGPRWARWVGKFLARIVWNSNTAGSTRVPTKGPVILVSNHTSVLDGPLLMGASPRPTHFLVKEEMFSGPIGWILKQAGQIPIDRNSGRTALQSALQVLKRGGVVGIFPEGVRGSGSVSQARAGAAWLAVQSNAAIIPVAALGTRRTGESVSKIPTPRRKVAFVFGHPIKTPDLGNLKRREQVRVTTRAIQRELSAHVARSVIATGLQLPEDQPLATATEAGEDSNRE